MAGRESGAPGHRRFCRWPPDLQGNSSAIFDDGDALVQAVAQGMGLIQAPDYMAVDEIRAKRVVEVLADYRPPPLPISLVYATSRQITPRMRVLIEALRE